MKEEEIRAAIRANAAARRAADNEVHHAFYQRNGDKLTSDGDQVCPRCGDNNGTHHHSGRKRQPRLP